MDLYNFAEKSTDLAILKSLGGEKAIEFQKKSGIDAKTLIDFLMRGYTIENAEAILRFSNDVFKTFTEFFNKTTASLTKFFNENKEVIVKCVKAQKGFENQNLKEKYK